MSGPAEAPAKPPALTVLMYHALAGDHGECEGADPHYAVGRATFDAQLAAIAHEGLRPCSVASLLVGTGLKGAIGITFDDGHESNARAAAAIASHAGSADLFVNPTNVGKRDHLDWAGLADLAKAGFSIQSHGHMHRYFDELSENEIEQELAASKAAIEDRIGQPVVLFAPPGGRLAPCVPAVARRLGYLGLCSSQVGVWRTSATSWNIPRFAVLATTGPRQFRHWILQDRWELAKLRLRHGALRGAKHLLGNQGYERLRARLLGTAGGGPGP